MNTTGQLRKRATTLKQDKRREAFELIEALELAEDLGRGRNAARAEHWQEKATQRRSKVETFLKREGK